MERMIKKPKEIFIGENALEKAMPAVMNKGKRAFIVTGGSMVRQGFAGELQAELLQVSIKGVVFSEVTGEPTDKMITAGVSKYLREECDFIIGFGGGSQLDAAKAIGAMVVHSGRISDYNGRLFENQLPYLIEIPSTAGTGSEATQVTIITDTKNDVKMLLKGDVLMPDMAIIDFRYTMSAPPQVTAWTGLDALTHAVEGYVSKYAFPECDEYALSAVKRIFKYLPIAYSDGTNAEAREQLSLAAYEAGVTICNSTVTIVHGMSRPIGALFHVPHGLSNAMLLSKCLQFSAGGAAERFAALAKAIGAADESADENEAAYAFVKEAETLCGKLNVPTLQEYGIDKAAFQKQIPKMAKDAMASGSPGNTRKNVTVKDMEKIYMDLY